MKNVLIMSIVAVFLLVAGTSKASDLCFWSLADTDSVIGRVGLSLGENLEGGIESVWRHDSERPGQLWAVYGIYQAPDAIDIGKILPFEWLPDLKATPYVGASVGIDLENEGDRTVAGPICGLRIQKILVLEYAYQYVSDSLDAYMNDGFKFRVGLHFGF